MNNDNIKIAEEMLRLRFSQLLVNEKYKAGEFKIPVHLALGHEAIAVAVDFIMQKEDQLVLSHRNIHYNIARAKCLRPVMDEYLLKLGGLAKGQLGSMNLSNKKRGIAYTSSILGNNLSVASGLALGKKVRSSEGIVIVVTGDGAIEEGAFHESLIFLKSLQLPTIVIIENNQWSLATKIEERRCPIDIEKIAESLVIPYKKLQSNDVYEYIDEFSNLREKIILDKTPVCIEVDLTSLGHWRMKKDGYPDGKFINYHAGPAPTVNFAEDPIQEKSSKDPVFVLNKHFSKDQLDEASSKVIKILKEEMNEECRVH